jgi:UDP-4-amino-4-deoxy-L-arabinose formyltransferase/UDP-glucuronic acid dehydrogenase (UDP-4-keto-hexauronic acid decarboxylating)
MRVVLVAEEAAGVQTLRALIDSDAEVVAVYTSSAPEGMRGATVGTVAARRDVEVHDARRVRDAALGDELRDRGIDLLLNVHSLYIVNEAVVDAPRIGSFNLHPGPLPGYAGLNAPSWAIVNGESRHAVTVHWMTSGVDTGAIAYEGVFDVGPTDTGLTVSTRCVREGLPLIRALVTQALADPQAIPRRPQPATRRRYYRKRDVPHEGRVDWKRSAAELDAFIRAACFHPLPSPWGIPRTTLDGRPLGVVSVERTGLAATGASGEIARLPDGRLAASASDELLALVQVEVDGRVRPAAEVLEPGSRLATPSVSAR